MMFSSMFVKIDTIIRGRGRTFVFNLNFKQFFDLTLCNSANGGKACVYRLSRHLLYGKTTRI